MSLIETNVNTRLRKLTLALFFMLMPMVYGQVKKITATQAHPQTSPVKSEKFMTPQNPSSNWQTATLAGGCFWGMEDLLRKIPGVKKTVVGYTGGKTPQATYLQVKTGSTGHAEAVQITFDPREVSFKTLLKWFFQMHDPTTENRQGNDIGTQYRSVIFYHTEEQKIEAELVKSRIEKSGAWKKPLVTQITPAGNFWEAEDYHQDYLEKNPNGYTCHFIRPLKEIAEADK